ncbi:hypothetical protein ACA910_005478 [Epithemia clementina (nom. ined.)]
MGSNESKPSSDTKDEDDTTTSNPTWAEWSGKTTPPYIHDHDDDLFYRLRNTQMTIEMKNKLVQCFSKYKPNESFTRPDENLPELRNTLIGDKGGQAIIDIAEAAASKEKRHWNLFDVSNTKIGDVGVKALFQAFASSNPTDIETLRNVCFGQESMDDEVAVLLAEALQKNSSWKTLSLHRSPIGKLGWQALSLALHSNTVWEQLELINTEIDDEAATVLFTALPSNKKWKELILSGLKISIFGAKALAGAWTVNTSWLKLDLEASGVGEDGIFALSEALCRNNKWEVLHLGGTRIDDNGAIALGSAMQHNTNWKVLDLSFFRIGVDGATALAAALEGHERWQYLIVKLGLYVEENEIKRIAQYLQESKDWERFVLRHFGFFRFDPAKMVEAITSRPNARSWKSLVLSFPFNASDDTVKALKKQLMNFDSQTDASSSDLLIADKTEAFRIDLNDYLGKAWHDAELYYFDGPKYIYSMNTFLFLKRKFIRQIFTFIQLSTYLVLWVLWIWKLPTYLVLWALWIWNLPAILFTLLNLVLKY